MKNEKQLTAMGKNRKMLLVLPLLMVPIVTLLFWAMGGGKGAVAEVSQEKKGFNIKLPNSNLKEDNPLNKLHYYDRAAMDSTKFEELKKKDPNYRVDELAGSDQDDLINGQSQARKGTGLIMSSYRDPNEEKVYKKLEALQRAISKPPILPEATPSSPYEKATALPSGDIQRLEQMMQSMEEQGSEDKEMQQISGLLENILDIQHPQRVQERLKKEQRSRTGEPLAIVSPEKETIIGSLTSNPKQFGQVIRHNDFYTLTDNFIQHTAENAIAATIAESQTCVNGSTVKLRLSQDIAIAGSKIPQNTFVYGVATLKGERLTIEINSIRYHNSLFPVELVLYDIDGLAGIFIPGAISRDVAKSSADRSMQGIGITTLDEGWGTQAAGAGLEAAKSLLSKKVKLVKVQLKAGYQVLLKEKKITTN